LCLHILEERLELVARFRVIINDFLRETLDLASLLRIPTIAAGQSN